MQNAIFGLLIRDIPSFEKNIGAYDHLVQTLISGGWRKHAE